MTRRPLPWLGLSLAVLGLTSSIAQAGGPQSAARAALLRSRDLGPGWSISSPAPTRAPGLACAGSGGPHVVRASARAGSPTFTQSSQGPFVFDLSAAFGSPAEAGQWWRQVVHPSLRRCFARVLAAGSGQGVQLRPTGSRVLPLAGGSSGVERYRVRGQARTSGQSAPVYLDVLILRGGSLVAELQVSSFDQPPADRLERRLARLLARRTSGQ
jgi:hypothetical protein